MKHQAILVAENDSDMRAILVDCLQPLDYVVIEAHTVAQAFERLDGHDLKLVVTDIEMPGAGLRYLKNLRDCSSCPIVALSGFGGVAPREAVAAGASACLEKPFRLQELLNVAAWLLGRELCGSPQTQ